MRPLIPRIYREAFCLMKYRAEDGTVEWLWNSRDGITPFSIKRFDAPAERPLTTADMKAQLMEHVDWHEDVFIPNYVPPIGSRVFVDLPTFDARTEVHNVRVAMVDAAMHADFKLAAERNPWVPGPARRPSDGRPM